MKALALATTSMLTPVSPTFLLPSLSRLREVLACKKRLLNLQRGCDILCMDWGSEKETRYFRQLNC